MDFFYRYKSYYRSIGMGTPILDVLIFRKMRSLVGGRIRLLLSGGAPLSPDIHDYVRCALTLPLVQGYGLTESCACGTIMDSVRPVQAHVQVLCWSESTYWLAVPIPRSSINLAGYSILHWGKKFLLTF